MGSLIRSMARQQARGAVTVKRRPASETIVIGEPTEAPMIKIDKGLYGGSCNRTACQAPGATWSRVNGFEHYCRSCAMEINRWSRDDRYLLRDVPPRHCDDYIDDPTQPECLRRFLAYNRLPAAAKYPTGDEAYDKGMEEHLGCPMWRDPVPTLFADRQGRRVRVTMASRSGTSGSPATWKPSTDTPSASPSVTSPASARPPMSPPDLARWRAQAEAVGAIPDDDGAHSRVWSRALLLLSWHATHGPD